MCAISSAHIIPTLRQLQCVNCSQPQIDINLSVFNNTKSQVVVKEAFKQQQGPLFKTLLLHWTSLSAQPRFRKLIAMPYPSRPLTPPWSQTPPAVPAFLQPAPLRTPLLTIHHPLCSRRSSKVPLPRIAGRAHPTVSQLDGVKAPSANADAQQQSPSATARTTFGFSHPDFVHAVEGEWFGYECAFSTPDGALINIPVRQKAIL